MAVTVASAPFAIGQALGAAFFPRVAQSSGAKRTGIKTSATRSALALALMVFPLGALVSYLLIPIVFGAEFGPAVSVSIIALVGTMAMMAAYVCSMVLAAEGQGIKMTIAQIASLAISVALLFVLGPLLGAVGAAIAAACGYIVLLVCLMISLRIGFLTLIPRSRDFASSLRYLVKGVK